jgi:hypothetical protein
LDWNKQEDLHIVFILVGSGSRGINGLTHVIQNRPRGIDLVDRIPEANRFEIPVLVENDRILVFAQQILLAATKKQQNVSEIDRLALYYVLKSEALITPRQIEELAKQSIARMDASDGRLQYDHLFRIGDRERMDFWTKNMQVATNFSGTFVQLSN